MARRLALAVLTLLDLAAFAPARVDAAAVAGRLSFKAEPVSRQASFLSALLAPGRGTGAAAGAVSFALPQDLAQGRDASGRWMAPALQAALASQGALDFRGDPAQAGAPEPGPRWRPAEASIGGGRISATGLPRVLLLENSATISPLSKGLSSWGWPLTLRSFADAESNPSKLLDPDAVDVVAVESPAGWGAGDEPSGPSQMSDAVAAALRDFVRRGGTAVFFDISQWDVEKVWPGSVGLAPVGPYAVSKLSFYKGPHGGISLSNFGEVADSLKAREAFGLVGSRAFDFADGSQGPVYAAWAMPDPGGGLGFVAGLAFHVFDQDDSDSLASAAQRLLLNLFLLSGARRISIQGQAPPPEPPAAATALPPPTSTPAPPTSTPVPPTPVPPSPTALPSPAPATPVPTLPPPSPVPTQPPPTEAPSPEPPTPVPSVYVPQPIPPAQPVFLAPTALPSPWVPAPMPLFLLPTPVPTPVPPVERPMALPMAPLPPLAPSAPQLPAATATPYLYPTPTPQPAPRPRPRRRRRLARPLPSPTPEARPTVAMRAVVQNALGCLASAPEPFSDGGVYIEFCLSHAANVRIEVYDSSGMKLWTSELKLLQPGQQQWWFDGTVQGRALEPGSYLFEITADYGGGMSESRQGSMTRGQDRS
ncbi:MAG TPA: hypothetical protein VK914_04945 [bacterium]|jgi:hypothetical protein|nr:hypothetical protein [bacterium]